MVLDNTNKWVDYANGQFFNACFNPGGPPVPVCEREIKWTAPTLFTQAVVHNTALKNACDGGVSTCVSTKNVGASSKSVQFVDLPANIHIDTYIKIGNILYYVVVNTPTGSVNVTAAPSLQVPKFGEVGVTVNNKTTHLLLGRRFLEQLIMVCGCQQVLILLLMVFGIRTFLLLLVTVQAVWPLGTIFLGTLRTVQPRLTRHHPQLCQKVPLTIGQFGRVHQQTVQEQGSPQLGILELNLPNLYLPLQA
jgi:hypothetical protein